MAKKRERVCKNCRFYGPNEECRRRAPRQHDRMEFAYGLYLQTIALAVRKLAMIDDDELDESLFEEVTEIYKPDPWRHMAEDDWCGEFEPAPPKRRSG